MRGLIDKIIDYISYRMPTVLFTGTYANTYNQAVQLSETAANFEKLEVFCENNDGEVTSVSVVNPNGKNFNVIMAGVTTVYMYIKSKTFYVDGSSIKCRYYSSYYKHGEARIGQNVATTFTQSAENIGIIKVLGYRKIDG